jgi:secondary thiamine-phosphate synthase enzyme
MQFIIKTSKKEEIIDITRQVQEMVSRYSIKEGIATVFVPHATAALTINENSDKAVCEDFLEAMSKIAPKGSWKHDAIDGNGDSHIKAAIIGPNLSIPIQNNRLMLGRWQGIMLCEFDGPRDRTVIVACTKSF